MSLTGAINMKTKLHKITTSKEVVMAKLIRDEGLSLDSYYSTKKRAKAQGQKFFKWEKWIVEV